MHATRRQFLMTATGFVVSNVLLTRTGFSQDKKPTRIVLLGTKGGPSVGKSGRSNPATLILINDIPYLVDCGYGTSRQLISSGVALNRVRNVFITHHHSDHIGGVAALKNTFGCPVYAPEKNQKQIPQADHWLKEGDVVKLSPWEFTILELPGHTLGHIAYWDQQHKWLFSGDVIFGLGCGRLFEGSHEQGYASLQRIKKLPPQTLIYCTHEYTERNLDFCRILTNQDNTPITGDSEALELYANELSNRRDLGLPSVPLKLSIEESTNPFLLAQDAEQFRYLRELRNRQ